MRWQVGPGQVHYSARAQDHETHKAAWATSRESSYLNLATMPPVPAVTAGSLPPSNRGIASSPARARRTHGHGRVPPA